MLFQAPRKQGKSLRTEQEYYQMESGCARLTHSKANLLPARRGERKYSFYYRAPGKENWQLMFKRPKLPNPFQGRVYKDIMKSRRRRQWHPTPVLLPGKSHGRRSLVGCSPWGHQESDTTERLHFDFSLSCIGEGNGNPLQCSCLENPRDRGAQWAAVYGVAQSGTRLK